MTPLELTEARKALGLSQAALARTLGVSPNTTNRWEKGERPIPPYLRLALVGLSAELNSHKFISVSGDDGPCVACGMSKPARLHTRGVELQVAPSSRIVNAYADSDTAG